jgi:hypothetical protein
MAMEVNKATAPPPPPNVAIATPIGGSDSPFHAEQMGKMGNMEIDASNMSATSVSVIGLEVVLNASESIFIRQKFELGAMKMTCCNRRNVYKFYHDKEKMSKEQDPFLRAEERGERCARFCCNPNQALFLEVKENKESEQVLYTMERAGCCNTKICLGCPAWCTRCSEESWIYEGAIPEDIRAGDANKTMKALYYLKQRPVCTCFESINQGPTDYFHPILDVFQGDVNPKTLNVTNTAPLMSLKGPWCFGGCLSLFYANRFNASTGEENIGSAGHLPPQSCWQAFREIFSDADQFQVDFQGQDGAMRSDLKPVLLYATMLTDYMFFERDSPCCFYEDNMLGCTLANYYCCGCVLPCAVQVPIQT